MLATEKILVIRGGAIGDFILTLPALSALRRQFPEAPIEVLGYPSIASLAQAAGLAQRIRPIESPALASFFVQDGSLMEESISYFREFELIISYLYDPDIIFQSNVARSCNARFIAGPHRPNEKLVVHATKVFLQPLEALGIFQADDRPRLPSFNGPPASVPCLAIHPGSGSELKNWPLNNWMELLRLLIDNTQWNFLLIGGEAEEDRLPRIAKALPPERVRLAQNLPLVELAGQMGSCFAFIGHDSGITHLAAALDLPGLILWAASNEQIWRPQSDKMKLLPMKNLAGAEVFAQARLLFGTESLP